MQKEGFLTENARLITTKQGDEQQTIKLQWESEIRGQKRNRQTREQKTNQPDSRRSSAAIVARAVESKRREAYPALHCVFILSTASIRPQHPPPHRSHTPADSHSVPSHQCGCWYWCWYCCSTVAVAYTRQSPLHRRPAVPRAICHTRQG